MPSNPLLSTEEEADPHAGEVDLTLLRHNLSLSPAQRLEQHDRAREFALIVWRAGLKHHGNDADFDALIRSKQATGRNKDLLAIPELEAIKHLRSQSSPPPPDAPK
jgi:hypothetical protein